MAMVLKPEQIIHLVSTIIATETYPLNMGAIKMLHKVVEHWGRDAIEPHLAKIMPGLIKVSKTSHYINFLYTIYWLYCILYRLTTTPRARFVKARSSAWWRSTLRSARRCWSRTWAACTPVSSNSWTSIYSAHSNRRIVSPRVRVATTRIN